MESGVRDPVTLVIGRIILFCAKIPSARHGIGINNEPPIP